MIVIEHRQMHRTNGLIDDFVVHGSPSDYRAFASHIRSAISSKGRGRLHTSSSIYIEVTRDPDQLELSTSLQNEDDLYPTMSEWSQRSILRVLGSSEVLEALCAFLLDLSGRGHGYSYISEYSDHLPYAKDSPEWRLHVQLP